MNRQELVGRLGAQTEQLRRLGVASLRLFGSFSRDVATPASDVDLLVTFSGAATFDRYMDVKFAIEDALGRRVDLVTEPALRPEIRRQVMSEAIRVA